MRKLVKPLKRNRRGKPKKENLYTSEEYVNWRDLVFSRDAYTCKACGKTNTYLEAHHIRRKSLYPELMYNPNWGITLCRFCHDRVAGREVWFEKQFLNILAYKQDKIHWEE